MEYNPQHLRHWKSGDWFPLQSSIASPYWPPLSKDRCTSSHASINFDELPVLIEGNPWAFLATCNQTPKHQRTGSNSQGLTHVAGVFVAAVRYQRNVVVRANRRCVHQGRQLGNTAPSYHSRNANTAVPYSTTNTIGPTPNQILSSLSCGDWTWDYIYVRELLF